MMERYPPGPTLRQGPEERATHAASRTHLLFDPVAIVPAEP